EHLFLTRPHKIVTRPSYQGQKTPEEWGKLHGKLVTHGTCVRGFHAPGRAFDGFAEDYPPAGGRILRLRRRRGPATRPGTAARAPDAGWPRPAAVPAALRSARRRGQFLHGARRPLRAMRASRERRPSAARRAAL